jgi:AcrR family transcriptional regulator
MSANDPAPNRNERRKARTRQALMDAARSLIATRGTDDLTIADIAERADVGVGSFYNHFATKEELIRTAAADLFERVDVLAAAAIGAADEDPATALAIVVEVCLRELEPQIVWAGFFAATNADRPMLSSPLAARVAGYLVVGHRDGLFEVSPGLGAFLLVGMISASLNGARSGLLNDDDHRAMPESMLRALGLSPSRARTATRRARTRVGLDD